MKAITSPLSIYYLTVWTIEGQIAGVEYQHADIPGSTFLAKSFDNLLALLIVF